MTGASVVIIGGGVEGLSTARAFAERGVTDVVVLERAELGSGGTGKSSGIVRCHYGTPSLAAMAWRSMPTIVNSQEVLGSDSGFRRTGYLVGVGEVNAAALAANIAMQQALGIDVAMISIDEAAALLPAGHVEDFAAAAYEPQGGYGDGHQTAMAFAGAARRRGVRIRQASPVTAIHAHGGRVTGVELAGGERLAADTVVVAAGPWTSALVAPLGVDLPMRTERSQLMVVDPGEHLEPMPALSDLVSLQYVRPEGRNSILVGNSDHSRPEWADPDDYDNTADPEYLEIAIPKFSHRFPKFADPSLSSTYAGCYDVTPDYNPVIGPSPVEGLYLCAGFGGHGYKISPAVGELMADVVLDGASRHPDVDHRDFRLERFAERALLRSAHPYVGAGEMR